MLILAGQVLLERGLWSGTWSYSGCLIGLDLLLRLLILLMIGVNFCEEGRFQLLHTLICISCGVWDYSWFFDIVICITVLWDIIIYSVIVDFNIMIIIVSESISWLIDYILGLITIKSCELIRMIIIFKCINTSLDGMLISMMMICVICDVLLLLHMSGTITVFICFSK